MTTTSEQILEMVSSGKISASEGDKDSALHPGYVREKARFPSSSL